MNILFISLHKFEDINSGGIYTDLMREFAHKGHNVFVISPRERRFGKPTEYVKEKGINILRVRTGNITKTKTLEKGISTLLVEKQFVRAIKTYLAEVKFDLILYATPPVTFDRVVNYVKERDNAKSYLMLKDIFPQNAVDINLMKKNSLTYKYFRLREKRLYKVSDYIGCMSQANVDYILEHNDFLDPTRVEICPNAINPQDIYRSEESISKTRRKYKIPQSAVVFVYGGNLGKPQGIDFLLQILRANAHKKEYYFLIIGAGTEYEVIDNFIVTNSLTNVNLINYLPKYEYDQVLCASDVGLLFLDNRFTIPNFPSRLLSYMEFGLPVLAATDLATDVGKVIETGKFGFWCPSGDIDLFNYYLNVLYKNKKLRVDYGFNARKYLEENYTVSVASEIILNHFSFLHSKSTSLAAKL